MPATKIGRIETHEESKSKFNKSKNFEESTEES
jgi:hypothetical protein